MNFSTIARDCGVSSQTIKEYFQILEDTLLGRYLPAYQKKIKRRLIRAPKFYMFDIGVVANLTKRHFVEQGSELFGKAFEHFIYMELLAHSKYSEKFYDISYWRTASQFEVDFILGEHKVAIEVKSSNLVNQNHLKGMKAFKSEYNAKQYIIISLDPKPRTTEDGINIMPWAFFLKQLWANEII